MKKRENGLDLLRILASFFIVSVHVCTLELKSVKAAGILNAEFYFFTIIRHFTSIGVICFFALSGAFVLKAKSTLDIKTFYAKSWKKIGIPTIIFAVFYLFAESLAYYYGGVYSYLGDISYGEALAVQFIQFLTGAPAEHMWYMYTLIGVYLIAPFIAIIKEKTGDRIFKSAALALCIWGIVDALIQGPKVYWGLGWCADILGIFMMGYVVHEWALERQGNKKSGRIVFGIGTVIIIAEYVIYLIIHNNEALRNYITPESTYNAFAVAAALCYVAAFTIFDIKRDFGYPSLLTFMVYLVHPAVMMCVFIIETAIFDIPYMEIGLDHSILVGSVNTIIVFILSFLVAYLIDRVQAVCRKKEVNQA